MSRKVFIKEDGNVTGPFLPGQLKSMASSGSLTESALICGETDGRPTNKWAQVTSVKGLFDVAEQQTEEASDIQPLSVDSFSGRRWTERSRKSSNSRSRLKNKPRSRPANVPTYHTTGKYSNSKAISQISIIVAVCVMSGFVVAGILCATLINSKAISQISIVVTVCVMSGFFVAGILYATLSSYSARTRAVQGRYIE